MFLINIHSKNILQNQDNDDQLKIRRTHHPRWYNYILVTDIFYLGNKIIAWNDAESRKVTKVISNKIDTFETRCLLSTIRYLTMICRMHSTSTQMVAMILTPNTKKEKKTKLDLREVSSLRMEYGTTTGHGDRSRDWFKITNMEVSGDGLIC